jgi:hypothetical protein
VVAELWGIEEVAGWWGQRSDGGAAVATGGWWAGHRRLGRRSPSWEEHTRKKGEGVVHSPITR